MTASIGPVGPRFLVAAMGMQVLMVFLLGLVFLAFDVRARDVRERMYEVLDRLISIALPRVRDFRGIAPRGFDGRGNYTLGMRDQLIFLEIDYMNVDSARGMNICVVTTAPTDEQGRRLLQLMGMPFRVN